MSICLILLLIVSLLIVGLIVWWAGRDSTDEDNF